MKNIPSFFKKMPSFSENTTTFLKKTLRFFENIKVFLENIKVFFAAWECVKTKPGYPIVSCRGRVRLPEDTKQTVFGRANLAPTHETTALSTFCPLFVKCVVCTYASVYTYGGISPHVRTHRPTRTYAWACTYMSLCQAPSYWSAWIGLVCLSSWQRLFYVVYL